MANEKLTNQGVDQSRFELRVLGQEWNVRLLRLSRESPVEAGNYQIYFDRSPDIFAIPKLISYEHRCLGLFRNNELMGYAFASYQKRYINQQVTDVIYLGNMHVFQKGLGRDFLKLLSDRLSRILPKNRDVKFIYAYIIEQNRPAMKLADRGYFSSKVVGQISMVNILLLFPIKKSRKYTVRKARVTDIDKIVELLEKEHSQRFLAPEMNRETFMQNLVHRPQFGIENYYLALSGNEIIGVCSAWDMTDLKKNRILKYGIVMGFIKWVYNLVAFIFGASQLPKAGEKLRDITIAEYAVKDRDPEIMEALLRYIYNQYRQQGYHSIIFGSSVGDPLLKATEIFISKDVRSNVILGTLQQPDVIDTNPPGMIYADTVQI